MNDTHPEIQKKLDEMLKKKSEAERLEMGCSMYDFAKDLVRCSLLDKYPDASQAFLRKKIFLRFYGNEFDGKTQEKIVKHWLKTIG